jgi:hypothetical protein
MIVIMDTEGVEGYAHANRKLRNIPLLDLFTGSWLQEVTSFSPRIFLSGSTNCWLGVFYTTSASNPFPGYLPLGPELRTMDNKVTGED